MKSFFLLLLAFVLVLSPIPVHAEALDDVSIRALYAEIKGAIHDPDKTRQLMGERLDDSYELKNNVVRQIDKQKPQNISATLTKQQTIDGTVINIQKMHMDQYQSTIVSLSYSDDHEYAYLKDSTISSGSVPMKISDTETNTYTYDAQEACSHTIALEQDKLKIMQAACNDQIKLVKQ